MAISEDTLIAKSVFFLFSYILIFVMLLVIMIIRYSRHYQFEYVWFCSKIKTVVNLVKITSYNYQVFNTISPSGQISGLSTNYYDLLKLNTDVGCKYNYRPCGYLDTLKNFLCIDRNYPCPINNLVADYSSKSNSYLNDGYQIASNMSYLSYNYYLYYSNTQSYGNAVIMLAKNINRPLYIDYYNFYLDIDAFNEVFKNIQIVKKDAIDKGRRILDDSDEALEEVVELALGIVERVAGNLIEILAIYAENKKLGKFLDYIIKKIEKDDDNIDIYFRYIGDNYYTKNYIGFQSVSDLENFLNMDFDIYKSAFPDKICGIFAILCFIAFFIIIILYGVGVISKYPKDCYYGLQIVSSIIYILTWTGFISHFGHIYSKISHNQSLVIAKQIQSDAFINNFLEEFVSKTSKLLSEWVIGIFTISIFLHFIGLGISLN